jgi:hypothetical protein
MVADRAGGGAPAPSAAVPFLVGSQRYREAPFYSYTAADRRAQQTVTPVPQITPGNFLSGVVIQITSTGGALGTANALTADGTLAHHQLDQPHGHGRRGDPLPDEPVRRGHGAEVPAAVARGSDEAGDYTNSINPAITFRFGIEVRDTLAVLANTDARSQYRINITVLAPLAALTTGSVNNTAPTVTVNMLPRRLGAARRRRPRRPGDRARCRPASERAGS